jgi:hypothetical protein
MKIGLYIVSALLFIIGVSVAVYLVTPASYSFEAFGIHLPKLPIAVWFAIPVALLAIFSILHMSFYSTKAFFASKKWKNDAKRLEDALYWSLIKEPTIVNFAIEDIRKSASILSKSELTVKDLEDLKVTDKLKDAAKVIKKIYDGEYIDLKKEKFAKHLSENNEIVLKNEENKLKNDPKYALKILDFKDKYPKELIQKALDTLVENEDFYTIKKFAKDIRKERFFKLLDRVKNEKEDEDLGFGIEILKSYLDAYNLNCQDYYKIAQVTYLKANPDDNLALFKDLQEKDEDALAAYLYLLFKHEMLDKAKEILDEHSEDEYKAYRALYNLKKSKLNIKLDDIINVENACK